MNNWKTTVGGIMGAIGFAATQVEVPHDYKWLFALVGATGIALLGSTAKDFNVHSTVKEVEKATEEKPDEREWGQS